MPTITVYIAGKGTVLRDSPDPSSAGHMWFTLNSTIAALPDGGNTQTFSGSFTKTDGTAGASGTAQLAGSLLLANNNFYRQFTDDPAITAGTQVFPQMHCYQKRSCSRSSALRRGPKWPITLEHQTAQPEASQLTHAKAKRFAIDLVASHARQSGARSQFSCKKLPTRAGKLTKKTIKPAS